MARSVRIQKIDRRGTRCTYIRWRGVGNSDKGEIEIPGGIPEFRQWVRQQLQESSDTLVLIGLAQWLAKNPNEGTNFTDIESKMITMDLQAAATTGMITIT